MDAVLGGSWSAWMQWQQGAGQRGCSGGQGADQRGCSDVREGKCGGHPKRIGGSRKMAHQGLTEVRNGRGWSLDFAIREVISV